MSDNPMVQQFVTRIKTLMVDQQITFSDPLNNTDLVNTAVEELSTDGVSYSVSADQSLITVVRLTQKLWLATGSNNKMSQTTDKIRPLYDPTAQEEFLDNLELNMAFIEQHATHLDTPENIKFAESIVSYYKKFEMVTKAQLPYATAIWQELNAKGLK